MSFLVLFTLTIHYGLVLILCIYGAHRIYHAMASRRLIKTVMEAGEKTKISKTYTPAVTVQIPLYNEKFVVERIIDRICQLDYPKEKLQIQVIDDSTDESIDIVAKRVAYHKARGLNIEHVRRQNRLGYKAGALAAAMDKVTGEFIAIFDADFLPDPDFLIKTVPAFQDSDVGLVQARWGYLNGEKNALTKLQTVMLDAHFGIEQVTRHGRGVYFNFNGTAGIWRKSTIEDAGGWNADTLTEDTDLSYRAQMKGWKFIYRPDIVCRSEIPENMQAFKAQQHRWAKGTIEVMKKLLKTIWSAPIAMKNKVEASLHLTANVTYLFMFVDSLFFLLPSIHFRQSADFSLLTWLDIPIFAFASLSHAYFFMSGQKRLHGSILKKLHILPVLLATSIGLGVNNGRAVIEALIGHKTGFVRTPKIGQSAKSGLLKSSYKANSQTWSSILELAMAGLYSIFLVWAVYQTYWIVTPFLILFALGFYYTSLTSLSESVHMRFNRKSKPKIFPSIGMDNLSLGSQNSSI